MILRLITNLNHSTCAGSYRFGPVVNEVTPCKGAFGPRGPSQPSDVSRNLFLSSSSLLTDFFETTQPVQILGSGFNGPITRLNTDVLFGDIFGVTAAVNGDSLVRATTRWGGPPNTQVGVTTIFNTCNTTYSSKSVWWGPSITKITELSGRAPIQVGDFCTVVGDRLYSLPSITAERQQPERGCVGCSSYRRTECDGNGPKFCRVCGRKHQVHD